MEIILPLLVTIGIIVAVLGTQMGNSLDPVQARLQQTPTYHLVQESGPDHAKAFTVEVRVGSRILGRGRDRSKRGAEQAAAESALTQLRNAASLEASG